MPRETNITQEQVNAVADALFATGKKVTTRAVRENLDGGSLTTILKYLQAWRAGQVRNHLSIGDEIDTDISRAINNNIVRKIAEATAEANAKITDFESDLSSVMSECTQQIADNLKQAEEIASLQEKVQTQSGQIEQLERNENYSREQISSERKAHDLTQVKLAQAELRIEQNLTLKEDLHQARSEAKSYLEEAAELRGKFIGLEQNRSFSS